VAVGELDGAGVGRWRVCIHCTVISVMLTKIA
jgi:hypothetical protein